jgi:hypothetical protein
MPSKTQQARPDAAPSARPRSSRSRRPATPEASPAALAEAVPEARPAGSTRKRNRSKPVVESAAVAPVAIVVPVVPVAEAAAPPAGRRRGRGRGRSEDPVDAPPPVSEPVGEPVSLPVPETVAEAPVEAAPPPARSRRGTARARVVEPVVDDVPPAPEPVAVAEPEAERPRKRGTAARRPRPEPPPTVTPQAPPPPPGPQADITPPADGALFGRYAVSVPGEEAAEVTWRSPDAGTALCSCLDFALSEDASCPHVQALQQQLSTRPANTVPGPVGSRIGLQHGACRRPLWLPGSECPPALDAAARQLLGAEALDDQAVPRLLRQAREAGHDLQVDEALWSHLAVQRDARWRVHRLQTLLPQGPGSELLKDLRPEPLLPLQLEGALFAVCAGRCILADDAVLQPVQQALAAAALWQRHFGVERVLVLAPSDQLDRWRRLLPADAAGWSLTSIERVAGDVALHQDLAPELVIVHEPAAGGLWIDADRAAALLRLRSAQAIVLPAADWLSRPAELVLRLAYVDADRGGAYAALLQAHGQRDEAGLLCGLQGLDTLRATLEPVLLMRLRAEVLNQLPERVDRVRRVVVPGVDRDQHAALAAVLATQLARWQRVGWLPDAAQRQLVDAVQALRRLCAGDGAPGIAAAKAAAVLSVLTDADAPAAKLVVFSQWRAALDALRTHLADAGMGCAGWWATDPDTLRRSAAERFRSDPDCRVLLVADPGSSGLDLQATGAQVLHLDRPWNPRLLARRFGRVHRRGKAHLVPVTQLLAEGSVEDRLYMLMAERRDAVPDLLDANAAEGFLQGDELAQWLADLAAVLAAPSPPVTAEVAPA